MTCFAFTMLLLTCTLVLQMKIFVAQKKELFLTKKKNKNKKTCLTTNLMLQCNRIFHHLIGGQQKHVEKLILTGLAKGKRWQQRKEHRKTQSIGTSTNNGKIYCHVFHSFFFFHVVCLCISHYTIS